jgi:RNA polymerase sigma-70 factor, ECF subfamily
VLDDTAIREFLRDDYPRLVAAVTFVSGSRQMAEDAVQEALLRAWIRTERGDEIESLPNWVAAVALNLSRSAWRRVLVERRFRERARPDPRDLPVDPSGAERVDIMRALAALPQRQREVAVMRLFLQMNTAETADVLDVSEGTVKSSFAAARASLATSLRIDDREEHDVKG